VGIRKQGATAEHVETASYQWRQSVFNNQKKRNYAHGFFGKHRDQALQDFWKKRVCFQSKINS
jgi:hypothetical protein